MAVTREHALPQVFKSCPVALIAGDSVEFGHSLDRVEALPPRFRGLVEGSARQPGPEVVACRRDLELVQDPHGEPFAEAGQLDRLKKSIADALANKVDLAPRLAQRPLPHSRARSSLAMASS